VAFGLSASPKVAMPTISTLCGPACVTTVAVSPIEKPASSALPLSMTTSLPLSGALPSARSKGFSSSSVSQMPP
jgi:hypothetical protein